MASTVSVLCPNGHRVTVKVTPTSSILYVIEEACRKKGFNANEFDIKSEAGKTLLDASLQIRYANIPNNAKLELVAASTQRRCADAKVSITLQLPDGARLKPIDFSTDATLWSIVEKFEEQEGNSLSGSADTEEPVLVYLRDQVGGVSALKRTTLKSVGLISGRGLLRLLYRPKSEDSKEAAVQDERPSIADEDPLAGMKLSDDHLKMISSISQGYAEYQRQTNLSRDEAGSNKDGAVAGPSPFAFPGPGRDFLPSAPPAVSKPPPPTMVPVAVLFPQQPDFSNFRFPSNLSSEIEENEAPSLPDPSTEPCDRERKVFYLDALQSPSDEASMDVDGDESFFDVTIEDLRSRMHDLKKATADEPPLLTQAMRERWEEAKYANYHRALVRVHFPDRLVLQGMFRLKESVASLYDFVSENLENPSLPYSLFLTPPRKDLNDKSLTMIKAGLAPAANVHFSSKGGAANGLSAKCVESAVSSDQVSDSLGKICHSGRPVNHNKPNSSAPNRSAVDLDQPPAKRPTVDDKDKSSGNSAAKSSGGVVPKWFPVKKHK